jgi:type II secretory pathway pseudopilin PulG
MKISKVTIIILGIVIVAAASAYFYMAYLRNLDEQATVKAQMAKDQATLAQLSAERENWQAQLVQVREQLAQKTQGLSAAQAELTSARNAWPAKRAESIEYDETLFELADGWNLAVTVVQAGEPSAVNASGITLATSTFQVALTGMPVTTAFEEAADYQNYVYEVVDNILGFITTLAEDEAFATAKIDVVSMAVPPMLTTEALEGMGPESPPPQPSATIAITVFTYRGG